MSKDLAASVRARLLALAKAQRVDFNQILVRFALERILYRLGQSAHADRFLLKRDSVDYADSALSNVSLPPKPPPIFYARRTVDRKSGRFSGAGWLSSAQAWRWQAHWALVGVCSTQISFSVAKPSALACSTS